MAGKMDCFGITDIGRERAVNEDQFLIADLNKSMRIFQTSLGLDHQTRLFGNTQGKVLAVADGMGGHEAGERASQLAVDSVVNYLLNTLQWYWRLDTMSDDDFRDELKAALEHCQAELARDVEMAPQRRGMGTTLTLAYIIWPRMYVVHVGDSRCYLLREGRLQQITRDHTIAQAYKDRMEELAESSSEETEEGPWSNVLWNVIGANDDELAPDVYHANLEFGDVLLLCSDGLTKYVDNSKLAVVLDGGDPPECICQRLIREANDAGGSDNITVVVGQFRATDLKQNAYPEEAETRVGAPDLAADSQPQSEGESGTTATISTRTQGSKCSLGRNIGSRVGNCHRTIGDNVGRDRQATSNPNGG